MTAIIGMAFAVLAAGVLAAPRVARWLERQRLAAPELAVLCMSFDAPRQARLELRIERPAASSDWRVRRIEWLAPTGVRIALRPDDPRPGPTLEASHGPDDPRGRWFADDPTIWARYPADKIAAHRVRLRLTFDCADGRRRTRTISAIFPAMDWTAPLAGSPTPRRTIPASAPELAVRADAPIGAFESRSWAPRWHGEDIVGLA
jgi:hypothetical protein